MRDHTTLTVRIGGIDCTCRVDFTYCEGEPAVPYYPNGDGYPGSPAEIDCIESVELLELEAWSARAGQWDYRTSEELGDCVELVERWVRDELSSGTYDDELLEEAGTF